MANSTEVDPREGRSNVRTYSMPATSLAGNRQLNTPTKTQGHNPSRHRTPSPRSERVSTVGQRSRMAELFGSTGRGKSPSSPRRVTVASSPIKSLGSTETTSPTQKIPDGNHSSRAVEFNKGEYPGFDNSSDEEEESHSWQVQTTNGWKDLPHVISFSIEQRYEVGEYLQVESMFTRFYNRCGQCSQANCGDAEYVASNCRYKVDFGSMKQYVIDNPSDNANVRRTSRIVDSVAI